MSHDVTCREFVDFLDDYLSGALGDEARGGFHAHLAACPSCVAYMKTYQAAVQLGRSVLTRSDEPVPEEVPEELVRAILATRKKA